MKTETRRLDQGGLRRTSAVIRAWDGPNSRVALEVDLDLMPWGPFEALGKQMTLLIPTDVESVDPPSETEIERALRHVEHAADRCAEFSRLGNGSEQLWRHSLETWRWLRSYLTGLWVSGADVTLGEAHERESVPAADVSLPHLPGAASTLEMVARALRSTPLAAWHAAIGDTDPEAPTREEAVQTLLGVVRLLATSQGHPDSTPAATQPTEDASSLPGTAADADDDELSFDFATGYDEGYQMGRRVGRALAQREFRERHSSYR